MLRQICTLGLVFVAVSAIVDQVCLGPEGNYTAAATACQDKASYCKDLYSPPVESGTDTERPEFCFSTGDTPPTLNKDMKKDAIADCPKSCGYCCLSPEWNCENPVGLGNSMNCDNVTEAMCNSTEWRVKIAKHCPNKCGFCLDNGCVDATPDFCASQPNICVNKVLLKVAMVNCAKTCQNCDGSKTPTEKPAATTALPPASGCQDVSTYCAAWNAEGYCANNSFSTASKKSVCAKTCKLC